MAEGVIVLLQMCALLYNAKAKVVLRHNQNFSTGLVLDCSDGLFTLDSGVSFQRNGMDIQENGSGSLSYPLTPEREGTFTCTHDGQTSQTITLAAIPPLDFPRHRSHCVPIPVNGEVLTELTCDIRPGAAKECYSIQWLQINPSGGFTDMSGGINQDTFSLTISADAHLNNTMYMCRVSINHDGTHSTAYDGAVINMKMTRPSVPPNISNAAISEADVGEGECVVTVRWSDPVISCNGSTCQYVLTVSPPTTECPSGDCVVGRGGEGFEEREQNVTLAVEQMYTFTVRADTCNSTQTGEESGQYTVEMEAHSKLCQYSYGFDVNSFAIQTIQTTWRRVFLRPFGEAAYTLIITPDGQRQLVMPSDCNSTHCTHTHTMNGNGQDYSVAMEAVGCVTRVTECHEVSNYCDPDELVAGVEVVELGYVFLEGQVTYNGISENSTATYTPNEGYSLRGGNNGIRICQNGSWMGKGAPTFSKDSGKVTGDTQQLSCGASVVITGVVCSVVFFTVGALLGALLLHLITRARDQSPTTTDCEDTVSRDRGLRAENIDLKSNEVYGVMDNRATTVQDHIYAQI